MDGGCRIIMDRRIAILGIIVEDMDRVERVNDLLHEYREYIVGRMGMPYRERGVSVISVVMDADTNTVSALSGKLGMTPGVSAKAVYSKT
jgi:putative iron-only hydrogenase system regulator